MYLYLTIYPVEMSLDLLFIYRHINAHVQSMSVQAKFLRKIYCVM